MSSNEDIFVSSDSFWEVDCFRRTVKRVEDGLHMCREMSKLIFERSEIEREYARKLQTWSKKWSETIDKGPEYGTNKAMLLGSLNEAESLAEVHLSIRDKLAEVQAELKKWKNEAYKKQMVGGCKEAKSFEDDFKKAQKPWAKKLEKVIKCRKDYHGACKLEKTFSVQASTEVNPDLVKKHQDRLDKSRKDVEATKDKYEEALAVLHKYNNIYVDDMTEVFERTQIFEEKRLRFTKDLLVGVHEALDISKRSEIPLIYDQLRQTISLSDASKDLKWWSQNHGIDMSMTWPTLEEYGAETVGTVSRRDKNRGSMYVGSRDASKNGTVANTQPVIPNDDTPIRQEPAVNKVSAASVVSQAAPEPAAVKAPAASVSHATPPLRLASYDVSLNPFADDDADSDRDSTPVAAEIDPAKALAEPRVTEVPPPSDGSVMRPPRHTLSPSKASDVAASNPFEDDDDEDEEDLNKVEGVPIEAVFDYEAQEADELSFKRGEKFEKLKDRDDQGWCTGRKDGRVGLYPDNYVKVVNK